MAKSPHDEIGAREIWIQERLDGRYLEALASP
jgi:hypothetical protein